MSRRVEGRLSPSNLRNLRPITLITITLQIRRFGAYRDIYKGHYAEMYEHRIKSNDFLAKLSGAWGFRRQDRVATRRSYEDCSTGIKALGYHRGYPTQERLRSTERCEATTIVSNRAAPPDNTKTPHSGNSTVHGQHADDPGPPLVLALEEVCPRSDGPAPDLWTQTQYPSVSHCCGCLRISSQDAKIAGSARSVGESRTRARRSGPVPVEDGTPLPISSTDIAQG